MYTEDDVTVSPQVTHPLRAGNNIEQREGTERRKQKKYNIFYFREVKSDERQDQAPL